MSGLAEILLDAGFTVSGSDAHENGAYQTSDREGGADLLRPAGR